MKDMKRIFKDNTLYFWIFLIILILFALFRIYLSLNFQTWFGLSQKADDLLMFENSHIFDYYHNWNILSLTKTMSYPLFLYFVNITGLPYTLWLSITWIVAGSLVSYSVYKFIINNKIVALLCFIFIIFLPIDFDMFVSLRIYRNAILAQFVIISFSLIFIFVNSILYKIDKHAILWGIVTGFFFTFTYYIKEDGITLLPILIVSILTVATYSILKNYNRNVSLNKNISKLVKTLIICFLPIIIFCLATVAYEEVNHHYFGVSEITTRNNGELGAFWKKLILIDDDNKNQSVWVPLSTMQKAWNASPTLQKHPEILEKWKTGGWAQGNVEANPIKGDLVAWSLRYALRDAGMYENEQDTNEFFHQVNKELDTAFDNGTIKKSDKIFIFDSLNGKTIDEIYDLKQNFISSLKISLFYEELDALKPQLTDTSQVISNNNTAEKEKILNEKFIIFENSTTNQKDVIVICNEIINIYHIISYLLVLLAVVGFIILFIHQIINKFSNMQLNMLLIFEIMLLGTFLVQIFAISWFTYWMDMLDRILLIIYYTPGCQGIWALFEVLSITSFFITLKNWKSSKKS